MQMKTFIRHLPNQTPIVFIFFQKTILTSENCVLMTQPLIGGFLPGITFLSYLVDYVSSHFCCLSADQSSMPSAFSIALMS